MNKTDKGLKRFEEERILRDKVVSLIVNKKAYSKKTWILSNLYEAYCCYEIIFEEIINNPKPNYDLLKANFDEIYHHTNISYNTRNHNIREIKHILMNNESKFKGWLKYPKDVLSISSANESMNLCKKR